MRFVTDILAKANLVVDGSVTLNTTANASVDTDKFLVQDGTVVKYRTGSEVLSDIGAQGALTLTTTGTSGPATLVGNTLNIPQYQAVLTNPVTGTGTINYLPKWTGSTSLGDSIASESGTSFIVSTSGETKVNIRSASGSGNALFFTESSVADRYLIGSPAGSGDLVFRSNSFSFATGTERMRLSSSGNLGLGTASPQYSLDSTGVINSTGFGTFLGFSTPPGRTYNYVTSFGSGNTINYPGTGTLGFQYNYFANNEFYTTAGGTSNLLIVGFRNQNYIRSTVSTVPFQMVGFNNRFDMHDANDLSTLGILNGVNSGFLREATASSLGGITTAYQFTATTRLRSGFYTTTRWGNENLQVADTTASQASTITDYDFLLNTTNVGSSSGGPGTITNFYLLRHVTNIGATGTITNRWGLYLTDSSFKSYHAGNFLIGTSTDAGYKLNVNGNAKLGSGTSSLALKITGDDNYIEFDNPGTYIKGGGNLTIAATSNMFFNTSGSSRMTIASNGAVRLNAYGSGTFTGTPTYNLAVDASGNIIETAGGVVDGSGTTNYVPKWSDPNTLTNSMITDDGTTVTVNGVSTVYFKVKASTNSGIDLLQDTAGTGYLWNRDNAGILFGTNNTERMRLDASGNLLVGGTSGDGKLYVQTSSAVAYSSTVYNGTNANIRLKSGGSPTTNTTTGIAFGIGGNAEAYFGAVQNSSSYADFVFQTFNGSAYGTRMTLDASGNLGLGVTPSAWSSSWKAFEFAAAAMAWTGGGANDFSFSTNSFFDATDSRWEYKSTGDGAARYSITALTSEHRWYNAPIGTAGNAISFTQAMTLDASGRLGIGTTSPTQQLETTARFVIGNAVTGRVGIFGQATATADTYITIQNTIGNFDIGTSSGGHYFYGIGSLPLQFYTNSTEKMRITSGGDVGIGTNSPLVKLDVRGSAYISGYLVGFDINPTSNYAYRFSNDGGSSFVNVMGGNFLIGTTTDIGYKLYIYGGNAKVKSTGNYGGYVADNSSTTGGGYFSAYQNGVQVGIFGVAGSISGNTDSDIAIFAEGGKAIKYFVNGSGTASHIMTSTGNVGIGTTNPSASDWNVNSRLLHIYQNTTDGSILKLESSNASGILAVGNDQFQIGTSTNDPVRFYTNSVERITIATTGQIRFNNYTSTSSFPGTAAGFIGFDSSGNLITVASAGGVSGSGTTNYVARWTASTTLGTGVLYDDGTNVGISTTSPQAKLDIRSSGLDTNVLSLYGTTGGAKMFDFRDDNAGGVTAAMFRMYNSSGTETVRLFPGTTTSHHSWILPTGNLGIGTTSPSFKLQVDHSTTAQYVTSFRNTADNLQLKIGTTTGALLNIQGSTINTNSAYNISLQADGGNVGINTTSPTEKLHVDSGSIYINGEATGLIVDAGGSKRIGFMKYGGHEAVISRIAGQDFGIVRVGTSDITNVTGITYDLYVGSSGDVGIGTTSPTYKLDVSGTGRFTGTISGGSNLELVNASGPYILVGEGTGVNQYGTIDWDATNNVLRIATQPYAFGASGGQINLTTGGNVGIGTTSPSRKFQVVVSGEDYIGIVGGASNEVGYLFGSAGLDYYGRVVYNNSNNSLNFYTVGTNRVVIDANGNLGIGTTAPGGKLDVRGSAYFRGSALGVTVAPSATGADIYFYEAGNPVIYLQSAGHTIFNNGYNFAIGSTSPDGRLYVERTATWSSGNLLGTNTVQYITYGSGASVGTVAISAVGAFQQVYFSGSATIGNGGRHGAIDSILTIGNTSSGTITVSQSSTLRAMSSISAATYFNPGSSTTITHLAGIRVLPDINTGAGAVTVTNKYGVLIGDASGGTGSITYTTRWGIYQEGASDNNYFAAKVLIGTTTATSDALYVNGTAYINNNMTVNGTVTELSSANYKRNISTLENTLEKVDKMRAVSYNRVGGIKKEIGLIAEEVEQVYPEFVEYDNNGRPMGLNYARLTAVLLQSVKELKSEINELKKNIN